MAYGWSGGTANTCWLSPNSSLPGGTSLRVHSVWPVTLSTALRCRSRWKQTKSSVTGPRALFLPRWWRAHRIC